MAPEQSISVLGGWKGYELCGWREEVRAGRSGCVLRLRRDRARAAYCSGCWQIEALHDVEWWVVRDLRCSSTRWNWRCRGCGWPARTVN